MVDFSRGPAETLIDVCGLSSSVMPGVDSGEDDGLGRRLIPFGGKGICAAERLLNVADDAFGDVFLPKSEFR